MDNNKTIIYRHADSIFIPNMERERELSEKGKADTLRIIEILRSEIYAEYFGKTIEKEVKI